jgi:hypothetical protein
MNSLGSIVTGKDGLTADNPSAIAFEKEGLITYVAYNYETENQYVHFSDGMGLNVPPGAFRVLTSQDAEDSEENDEQQGGNDDCIDDECNSTSDSHIVQQANGDLFFSIVTSNQMQDARVFVKVNGIQVYAGLTNERPNGDGSYTYHYTRAAQNFQSGDVIEVRFFHFDPLSGVQVFSPGPYAPPWFNWYPPVTYQ